MERDVRELPASFGKNDSSLSRYFDAIDSEIDLVEQHEEEIEKGRLLELAEADRISSAAKVAKRILDQIFTNQDDSYGDDEKARIVIDHLIHQLNLRDEDDIERQIRMLLLQASPRHHGIDRIWRIIEGLR